MLLQLVRFNVRSLEQLSITEKRPAPAEFVARDKLQDDIPLTAYLGTS